MKFTNNKLYLNVKDHSVSGETFELQHDEKSSCSKHLSEMSISPIRNVQKSDPKCP